MAVGLGVVAEKMLKDPAPLYIVMVDHGDSDGSFHLDNGDGEKITPTELATWLSSLETSLATNPKALEEPRVIIMGACYSGSFIPTVSAPGRIIVTSAAANEESYKGPTEPDQVRSGEYFIESLFSQLVKGQSLKSSFTFATESVEAMTRIDNSGQLDPIFWDNAAQHPLLDDNGNKEGSNVIVSNSDGNWARTVYLGLGKRYDSEDPNNPAEIVQVTPTLSLSYQETTANLWAEVNNAERVAGQMVTINVRTPNLKLVSTGIEQSEQLEIETLPGELLRTEGHQFANSLNLFNEPGRYDVFYWVTDSQIQTIPSIKRSTVYKDRAGNQPPVPFKLLSPEDGSETHTTVIFDWAATIDPDKDPLTYLLLVATDANFNQVIYRKGEMTETIAYIDATVAVNDRLNGGKLGLRDDTQYFWKVEAIDAFGARASSPVFSFITNNTNEPPNVGSLNITDALDYSIVEGGTVTTVAGESPAVYESEGNYLFLTTEEQASINVAGYESQTVNLDTGDSTNILLVPTVEQVIVTPGYVGFEVAATTLQENQGTVNVLVHRQGGSSGAASVQYTTTDGSTTADRDYVATKGSLTWADQETLSKVIPLTINDDNYYEGDETLIINLFDANGVALGNSQLIITIVDNETEADPIEPNIEEVQSSVEPANESDPVVEEPAVIPTVSTVESPASPTLPVVQFSQASYTVREGQTFAPVTLTRSNNNDEIRLTVITENDSAIEGEDYVTATQTFSWVAQDANAITFDVAIKDDETVENQEQLRLLITDVQGATIGELGQVTLSILDNDGVNDTDSKSNDPELQPVAGAEKTAPINAIHLENRDSAEEPDLSSILPNMVDESGFSLSINKMGVFGSSKTAFKGGISIDKNDFAPMRITAPGQSFKINAIIEVTPTDRGKLADVLYVIGTEPPTPPPARRYDGDVDTVYSTINHNNVAAPIDLYAKADVWMAQFTEPFKPSITLDQQITLTLWEGPLDTVGMYYFFVGYRLDDGLIVYVSRPIMVEVQ